ncbi:MAG: metal transporter [Thermodesulfobacteriota bacterium]
MKNKPAPFPEPDTIPRMMAKNINSLSAGLLAGQFFLKGAMKYINEFNVPFWTSLEAFLSLEKTKTLRFSPFKNGFDYFKLLQFNQQIAEKGFFSSFSSMNSYHSRQWSDGFAALLRTLFLEEGCALPEYLDRLAETFSTVIDKYPRAIADIKSEYGFHFENGNYTLAAETERFLLYQVLPTARGVAVRGDGKPILIVPPYVLGPSILAFLPGENKSYVHAFANQGIPTYIRIMKDIHATAAVQVMTGEDDAADTGHFCSIIMKKHHKKVTLNGFCQGGFIAVVDYLTGELDHSVDALITCVAPMDGTRSKSLVEYLQHLPRRYRDLGYAVKSLPGGNQVVDGQVMSWVYKLKSMEREAPLFTFYRDLTMFEELADRNAEINKTWAALSHWLIYDRTDLPVAITQMSFDSYTIPVSPDGELPFRLFNRPLNFKRIQENNIPYLICYAEKDDLVDKAAALAPTDFVQAQVTVFPKGHGAIATSWSDPKSECALHTRFGDHYSGPVRFQLDLEENAALSGKKS